MIQAQADITQWMDEAGKFPLLSRDETLRITKEIQDPNTKPEKRKKLITKIVEHNLRLVVSFVHPFMDSRSCNKWGSVETLDYLQMGVFGLIRAAEKYNPERGYAFSTYAMPWIRSFVGRYNMKASTPFKISEEACRSAYSYERYGKVSEKAKVGSGWRTNPEQMYQIVKAAQSPISLYSETESGTMLIDVMDISQPESVDFYENSFNPTIEKALLKAKLTEREDLLIRALFIDGLKRGDFCERYEVTEDDYGKIKSKAFRKIKKALDPVILES